MLMLIANEAPLGPEQRDHRLRGSWERYRECHVGGDFLLIYRVDDTDGPSGSIYFARVGTHAELFESPPAGHPLRLRKPFLQRRISLGLS